MDNNGFIVIHRKMLDWEWYEDTNTVRLFLHCLLKANWKNSRFQGIDIPRGSFVTGLPTLSKETGLSVQQVRTCIKRLISTGELTDKSYSKFRVITVNNYNSYQDINRITNRQLTGNQQATNRQLTTIEQKKQSNKETNNNINNTIYDFVEQNFGRTLSPIEYEEISQWIDNELTRYAIKQAVINNKCSIKYISRILNAYERENIKSVQQAHDRERQYIEAKSKNKYKQKYVEKIPEWFNQEIKREEVVYTDELKREYEEFERAIKGK